MNLRKYIREQISEGISNNDTEILIDKQALKKAVEQYIDENPEKDLAYVNDSGMRQDAYQILNFIMGNSSRYYLEKIANLIGKDISDFEYEQKKYISNLGKPSDYEIDSKRDGPLDESLLYEAKMPNEDFAKIVFEYDFPNNEKRLELINIIKDYFGEPLNKGREDRYWSTYVPKLELENFLFDAQDFNPYFTKEVIQANRFKPLTKELKDGDIIKFFDYTAGENNPPRAEGYLKPGFIQRNKSLMKWNGGSKEAWIDNSMIDKYYFYHGDVSDIKGHPGSRKVDSDYVKIFFDDAMFDSMNAEQEDELRNIITAHKGQLRYVFGKDRASGGQRYTLVPKDLSDDFIQAAYNFGAYEAETERNIRLEDKALNEIRKIVRGVINKVIK
jgi:hypothetical protein